MTRPVSLSAPHDLRKAERIDLVADMNAQDDDGNGWSMLSDARDPSAMKVGAMLLAGNSQAVAVVRVLAVDDDDQVHFTILPASVDKNRHSLNRVGTPGSPRVK